MVLFSRIRFFFIFTFFHNYDISTHIPHHRRCEFSSLFALNCICNMFLNNLMDWDHNILSLTNCQYFIKHKISVIWYLKVTLILMLWILWCNTLRREFIMSHNVIHNVLAPHFSKKWNKPDNGTKTCWLQTAICTVQLYCNALLLHFIIFWWITTPIINRKCTQTSL